jgi:branched-chain amino acid transport system permease protein
MFGIAGGLYAHTIGSISAADFWFPVTFVTLAMLVLGGSRSLFGAVVGAGLLSAVEYVFQEWQNGNPALGLSISVPAGASDLVIALVLILVLVRRPDGLTGGRELPWPRLSRRAQPTCAGSAPAARDEGGQP